jgi:hypothetical protein
LLSAKRIPAGKSGQIEVRIKTEGFSGAVEKRVNVLTNDPRRSTVTLSIKATVVREIDLSAPTIYFGNTPKGKEARREIILTLPAGKSIKILSVASTDPNVIVKLDPLPGSEGKKLTLTAIQRADAKPGYHFGQIIVKTNSTLTPNITIYERGIVTASGN